MPYKDKEKNREYQRAWARRKKAGLSTKTKNIKPMSEMERKKRRREAQKRYRAKITRLLRETFPTNCEICDSNINTCLHRIDWEYHDRRNRNEYLRQPEKYIKLCYACHKGVHFAHEKLKLSWNEIKTYLARAML